jgi:hydroxyacylglutathione hydrolase
MYFERIYDDRLAQASYLIGCQQTGEAVVIDPERDVDRYIRAAEENGLRITAITETHIHADFLSGSRELADITGAKVYLSGEGGEEWKYAWLDKRSDGGWYTHELIHDGDSFNVGNVEIRAVHTPGHTPEHLSFLVFDHGGGADEPMGIATGDFVFVGDVGRPDLLETAAGQKGSMGPAAENLYESLKWFDHLDDYVQVWPGHGAGSACGKALGAIPVSTVGYERRHNEAIHNAQQSSNQFVQFILEGQPDPPWYFARMKKENREGPALLGTLPKPEKVDAADLVNSFDPGNAVLVDTRDWNLFRQSHIPGSYYIPFNRSFPTVAGSYIKPSESILLVIEPENVEVAVRDLVRVGLDKATAYTTPDEFTEYLESSGKGVDMSVTTAEGLAATLRQKDVTVLDVRKLSEYDEAHIDNALQLAHTRLPGGLDNLPSDEPLYVHCQSGARSAVAAAYLQAKGKNVVYVSGEFDDFGKLGINIVSSPKKQAALEV